MTGEQKKETIIAAAAFQNLLDGQPPDGTDPRKLPTWGWLLQELIEAHETGGPAGVAAVWKLRLKTPGLQELMAEHASGRPLAGAGGVVKKILDTGFQEQPIIDGAQTLDDLAPFIRWIRVAGKFKAADRKETAAAVVCQLLLSQGRLILDTAGENGGTPYIVGESGEVWPLVGDLLPVKAMLSQAGLNFAEPAFKWLTAHLETAAYRHGRRCKLARFWTRRDGALYVSCGLSGMVRAMLAEGQPCLELLTNGQDDVFFASDASLPAWDPTAEPLHPSKAGCFRPVIVTPPMVPSYTPEVQTLLRDAWIVAFVADVRPLPLLAAIGDAGGGKTHLIRAVCMLAALSDPTTVSEDPRDLWTLLVRRPVVALDNVDSKPPSWLPDVMAASITGVAYERRKMHTNLDKVGAKAQAALAISSRTAAFARPDVAERTLPILTGVFGDADRISDARLVEEIREKRSQILTWAVMQAVYLLERLPNAPVLPGRFVDFGRVVWAYSEKQAPDALRALEQAQALTVGDADPLIAAIIEHLDQLFGDMETWRGTASGLVKALSEKGVSLPYLGGGKAIAQKLREAKGTLALFGVSLSETMSGNNPMFALFRR